MPDNADLPDFLVDTSVAIALLVADHDHHAEISAALDKRHLGLSGHAAFETFSVLTRLPPPSRQTAMAAHRLMMFNFPGTRFLSSAAATELIAELARADIAGGSVYDPLVGAAAREHGLKLVTRDSRALGIYRALGVEVETLP